MRGGRSWQATATTPVLLPSGEDANPLNKRLPAEVISRRRAPEKKKVEDKNPEEVQVDLRTACSLRPDARLKWLGRACKMAEEGKASVTELFDIVSSRKFAAGLPSKVARRIVACVHEYSELFSEKQARHLKSDEWALNAHYGERADADADAAEEDGDDEPRKAPELAEETAKRKEEEQIRREALEKRLEAEEKARRQRREERQRQLQLEQEAANRRREAEAEEARRRQLEAQVDNSLDLLERLGQQRQLVPVSEPKKKEKQRSTEKGRGGLSRSRSISARSKSRDRKRRARSRSAGGSRKKLSKRDFDDALRRRMAEREAEVDSARIPVVDPGHAQRWQS